MGFLEKIADQINRLDRREFTIYSAIAAAFFVLILSVIVFRYYRQINQLKRRINVVNELREETQRLLTQYARIEQQKAQVNELLTEDEDFKLGGYIKDLLTAHHLDNKKKSEQYSYGATEGDYRESIRTIQLVDMSMQELAQLLDDIEHKKRVYIKSIEITRSKKRPHTIDVTLTVATLQSKEKAAE